MLIHSAQVDCMIAIARRRTRVLARGSRARVRASRAPADARARARQSRARARQSRAGGRACSRVAVARAGRARDIPIMIGIMPRSCNTANHDDSI
jgi:hypothetical protein